MSHHAVSSETSELINRIIDSSKNLYGRRILVLGDIMVDEYIWGEVKRISPEAPVPVVHVKEETMQLGGAANVVHNLKSLETEVELVGVVGADELGQRVLSALNRLEIDSRGVKQITERETIRKTRIIAHNQQVVRVDRESIKPIGEHTENRLIRHCLKRLDRVDAVIVSDYAKGTLTEKLVQTLTHRCREQGKICAIDPKVKNSAFYTNCTVITPNHHEASQMTGIDFDGEWKTDVTRTGHRLLQQLCADAVLVTCGERGMAIFEPDDTVNFIDTVARSVYDVTGAGDTVISALTLALTSKFSCQDAAVFSNFAAGVVVGKVGTATATVPEIIRAMKAHIA